MAVDRDERPQSGDRAARCERVAQRDAARAIERAPLARIGVHRDDPHRALGPLVSYAQRGLVAPLRCRGGLERRGQRSDALEDVSGASTAFPRACEPRAPLPKIGRDACLVRVQARVELSQERVLEGVPARESDGDARARGRPDDEIGSVQVDRRLGESRDHAGFQCPGGVAARAQNQCAPRGHGVLVPINATMIRNYHLGQPPCDDADYAPCQDPSDMHLSSASIALNTSVWERRHAAYRHVGGRTAYLRAPM